MAALAGWWLARRDARPTRPGEDAPLHSTTGSPSPRPSTASPAKRAARTGFPRPDLRELAARHETKPDAEEWKKLLGLLQQPLPEAPSEEDRDITDAVKARFAAHAGPAQVDELASIFHYSSSMEVGQNALEVLGALQSGDFQQRARQIIADVTLQPDDQVVTALARSLARNGTPQDLMLIFDRIDNGTVRDDTEYNGMDGLMSAIHGALAAEMEPVLCEAVSNKKNARTWPSRLAAASALRNHSTSASTRALSQAARNDPDSRVATEAAESLAYLRAPED
jgi:hypothetical protein